MTTEMTMLSPALRMNVEEAIWYYPVSLLDDKCGTSDRLLMPTDIRR